MRGGLRLHSGLSAVRTSTSAETAHLELAGRQPFFKAHPSLWSLPSSGPAVAVTPAVAVPPAMPQSSDAMLLHRRHSEMGVERGGRWVRNFPGEGGGCRPCWYAHLVHWVFRDSWCAACILQGPQLHKASTGHIRHLPKQAQICRRVSVPNHDAHSH